VVYAGWSACMVLVLPPACCFQCNLGVGACRTLPHDSRTYLPPLTRACLPACPPPSLRSYSTFDTSISLKQNQCKQPQFT